MCFHLVFYISVAFGGSTIGSGVDLVLSVGRDLREELGIMIVRVRGSFQSDMIIFLCLRIEF